jgi:hypothetical protein
VTDDAVVGLFQQILTDYRPAMVLIAPVIETDASDKGDIIAELTLWFEDNILGLTSAPIIGTYTEDDGAGDAAVAVTVTLTESNFQFAVEPKLKTYSVNDFMHQLDQKVQLFNEKMTKLGINQLNFGDIPIDEEEGKTDDNLVILYPKNITSASPRSDIVQFLKMKLTADSSLQITCTNTFLNCFVLEFTDYGMQILGVDKTQLHKVGNRYYFAMQEDTQSKIGINNQFVVNNNLQVPNIPFRYADPANTKGTALLNSTPLYECCDQRVYVAVSTHLPMDSHVLVQNEVQTSSRDIVTAFFENQLETTLMYDAENVMTHRLKGISYSGQTHMVKKTDANIKWFRLKDSYDLRYLRFYLTVCYKLYDSEIGFYLKQQEFPIEDDNYWQIFVRFISDY